MSAYMCEGCGKEAARPTGFKAVTFTSVKSNGSLEEQETWILCRTCGVKVAESVENMIVGGHLGSESAKRAAW